MDSLHTGKRWVAKEAERLAHLTKGSPGIAEYAKRGASPIPRDPEADIDIPDSLIKGDILTKISNGKRKQITFRIDPDEGQILYESRNGGIIPIETIKELRSGIDARYYRLQFKLDEQLEDRWITIIYILDGTYKTLHVVAPTREIFKLWDTAIRKLYMTRQGLMSGLGNAELREAVWERQYWTGADEDGNQKLEFEDVERLCLRLNIRLKTDELVKLFNEADTEHLGYLDFSSFKRFAKTLKRRPEIEAIYAKVCSSTSGKLDFTSFEKFMRETQKSKLTQDELKSVFAKYASAPMSDATNPPPSDTSVMSLEKFATFLSSSENAAFSEQGMPIWQDMTRPISEYYVSSSHNTYLVGHQLVGVSTIEGYIRALLHSCRSVELDIYDGEDEPMIYHGKTLTSKVSLRDICQAINKYAFVTSPYPVLISAEVHCCVEMQDKMVDIMDEVFGDSLIQAPVEGRPVIHVLPSPEELKNKFLLKAKNLYVVEHLAAVQAANASKRASYVKPKLLEADPPSDTSSSDSDTGIVNEIKDLKSTWKKLRSEKKSKPEKPKIKMSFRLAALLVYTVGVKCHGINPDIKYAPEHIFSLSENSAIRLLKASMLELVKHTETHLVRVYPKGTRVNSTNYQPHRFWAAGAQVVAINWQTFDLGYMINAAMFQRNGRAGYVLKPDALRLSESGLLQKRTQHYFDVTIISAQQLPRKRDVSGREIIDKTTMDPFVEVSLYIPDWTQSPFLPESAIAAGARYMPSTDPTTTTATSARTVTFSTPVTKNNGFNPVWQEELCLPFDCIGDMKELIFVQFAVRQKGADDDDDEPIAVYCTPLSCLQMGLRHLPLHDSQLNQYLFSTLFVEVNIRDID